MKWFKKRERFSTAEAMRYMRENKIKMTKYIWRMLEMCDGRLYRLSASGKRLVLGQDGRTYYVDAVLMRQADNKKSPTHGNA